MISKKLLLGQAGLILLVGMLASSAAFAWVLPPSVLGPNNPQPVQITNFALHPVYLGGHTGGAFGGTVGGHLARLWCVDSQRGFPWGTFSGSVITLDKISLYPAEVRSALVTNSSLPYSWEFYTGDAFLNSATTRYWMVAWLIEQFTGFPAGPDAPDTTTPNGLKNIALQTAIWKLMRTTQATGFGPTVAQLNTWDSVFGAAAWVAAAKLAVQNGYFPDGWAVLSWMVDANGDLTQTEYQTLLVQVVPEPGFYGLLGLGLSALIFFTRRRRQPAA
jgi:hypothetical protein